MLIEIAAASLNFPDLLIVQNKYQFKPPLPFVPGSEYAGIVRATGPGVTGLQPGQPIACLTGTGGFGTHTLAPAQRCIPLPEGFDLTDAAAFIMTYGTSYHALLDRGALQPGETVLVLGAAGGIGTAAIQIAKHAGAHVIAAASSAKKCALAQRLGADATIDYSLHGASGGFRDELKRGDYDVVHRLTPLTPTMPSKLATRCKKIDVPFVLGPLNGGVPWPKGFDDRRRAEKEWLSYIRSAFKLLPGYRSTRRDASAILIASGDTLEQMPDSCRERCIYIPENGIDPERFGLLRERGAELPMRCVFLGRLVPYKGADLLIKATAEAMKRGELTIKIVGEGPQRSEIEQLVKELGVEGHVELCGWVAHTDVQRVLADSDFMAVPSIREFGGGVVLEAMALGLPAVVVDYGGPAELVTDTTGVRVPIGKPDAIIVGFRDAVAHFAKDPAHIDQLGKAAKARVDALFTWSAKAGQTLAVYRWLMGTGDKPDFGMPFPDVESDTAKPVGTASSQTETTEAMRR